jgi:acyl-CoA synthetase (AMP-forming)/AMP-acid ligase II
MTTVRTLIDARAESQSDDPFLFAPEPQAQMSYARLRGEAVQITARLRALGMQKTDKVAFLLNNGYWTTSLFLGAMYGGQVIVPLNAAAGPGPLAYVLEHSDARVLFVSAEYRERFASSIDAVARPITIIDTDPDTGPLWPEQARSDPAAELPPLEQDDDALLIYTSGTTGRPKGVVLSHAGVIAGGRNVCEAHGITRVDRVLCVLPLYHINGEIVTVMAPLVSGSSVVMPHRFGTSTFWSLVEQYECTWFSVVPTIISYLLERADRDLSAGWRAPAKLRFGRSASAPLPPAVHRAFEERFQVPMIETLGLTETAAPILSNPMPPAVRKTGSPGIAFGNEVEVVDEHGTKLPAGAIGEVWVRGPNVMKHYYKNPEATADTLNAEGWLRTGDQGYRDEDGYFYITGRLKELIIKGGENVAPREIDDVLYRHPAVLEAAAFAAPDPHYGQEIMAAVVIKPGCECTAEELLELCAAELGPYKTPKQIHFLDELPKGPSGKVQRLKIAEQVLQSKVA